ncbi:hypothetical protein DDB_G0279033 [Dictyostelium discoideum AX4]|uniref:Uncharacterized protein n=1 Tax=Dictyostelium discoideum TaxID=44689 RepID=Q54XD2_DICDI|nr:hypothetical protein DDB_G0279033 [Dictyostelium discoideum AX4]EAL67938.1 hypothetical protein DDB_G0279033 [Dictyostelium discoideum AX4]|eukprot:XP_641929.1 hypothetical protein DDB_G0279033 [Dictyostelium discoideum AX4]
MSNVKSTTPSKGIFDSFLEKLTPNKTPTKRSTFNGSSTPTPNGSNNQNTPIKVGGGGGGGGSTQQQQQQTPSKGGTLTTSASTNLLGQFQLNIETNNINRQSDFSTNLDDFGGGTAGGMTNGGDLDDSEKMLTYKDSTIIVNKELLGGDDHYLGSIEPQLSVLNKPIKKEIPKLNKQQSFHSNKNSGVNANLYIDPSTPISALTPQTSTTITSTSTISTSTTTNISQLPIQTQQIINNTNNTNTTNNNNNNNINTNNNSSNINNQPVNNNKQQQQQQQQQILNNNNNIPIQQQINEQTFGGDIDSFSFANLDIPMACRLFLDHLKSENSELKRQLNIVLNDNADQWEQTINLKSNIEELELYNNQLDQWSESLRTQLMNSAELLVNHHRKIDNLYELLSGVGEQKDSFQSLYEQSQEQLSKLDEKNSRLNLQLKDYKILTKDLDLQIKDLNKEIRDQKDFSIVTIIWRIKNGIEPSGIERKKSIQEKNQLLDEAVRVYQLDYNELVLLRVITFLKNTLSWKVFIQILKNNYDSLDYYIKYCKQTKKFNELKLIYRETHNHLEEGLLMLKEALDEKDTNLQLYSLYSCVSFFELYEHLYFYKATVLKHIDSIKNGINLNWDNLDFKTFKN